MTEGEGSVSAAGAGYLCGCSLSRPFVTLMVPSCGVLRVCASEGVDPDCGRGQLSEQVGVVNEEGMCWAGCEMSLQCRETIWGCL